MSRYILLCATVSLATATLALVAGTVLAQASWMWLSRARLRRGVLRHASLLFFIRTLPLSLPVLAVCCVVLPSFLRFEPRSTVESPETGLISFALLSVVFIVLYVVRLVATLWTTQRVQKEWLRFSRRIEISAPIPVYELKSPDSLIAVTGIFSPRMFIGERILNSLSRDELEAAIAHEISHVRSLDNFKQAVLTATRIPWLFAPLDRAFRNAAEICADARAMQCKVSPLDLGGAIVKAARLKAVAPSIVASHLVPQIDSSALRLRLEHLHVVFEQGQGQPHTRKYGWMVAVAVLILYFSKLQFWLMLAHRVTELLVR